MSEFCVGVLVVTLSFFFEILGWFFVFSGIVVCMGFRGVEGKDSYMMGLLVFFDCDNLK